jgi:alpha-L-fucosidase 2
VDHEPDGVFTSYARRLDFATGEATVSWLEAGARITRRLFVSRADNVVVLSVRAEESARAVARANSREGRALAGSVVLVPHPVPPKGDSRALLAARAITYQRKTDGPEWLTLRGTYPDGKSFGAVARVTNFRQAAELLILVRLYPPDQAAGAEDRIREQLGRLPADYDALLERHLQLHGKLYNRVRLDLADNSLQGKSNEEVLLDSYNGRVPNALHERMFNFGRYLLISSTGELPANLQGVWNGEWDPPWSSDYTMDENLQMNYWQALPGNMAELTRPYFRFIESQLPDWRENAQALFGCRGALAPARATTGGHNHHVLPGWPWHFWTAGAGWLAQRFFDYWLFSADREFLAAHVVPLLKEIVRFYEDFLVMDVAGLYLFGPSVSPENTPAGRTCKTTVNATMDVAVAREVLTNLIAACEELATDADWIARCRALLAKLPAYQVNEDGALREWLHAGLADNYHHRHLSHVYPAFPGLEARPEKDPWLYEACRVALDKRLVVGLRSQTAWSLTHLACAFARLGDGDRALECLELICRGMVGPNLFTYHNDWRLSGLSMPAFGPRGAAAPFQIDANLGLPAAVMEMLLFSTGESITLLPALPKAWRNGSVTGLAARGGFEVDIAWRDGKLVQAVIRSKLGRRCLVRYGSRTEEIQPARDQSYVFDGFYL